MYKTQQILPEQALGNFGATVKESSCQFVAWRQEGYNFNTHLLPCAGDALTINVPMGHMRASGQMTYLGLRLEDLLCYAISHCYIVYRHNSSP